MILGVDQAVASSVDVEDGVLKASGDVDETNDLQLQLSVDGFVIEDSTTLEAGEGCAQQTPTTATCESTGVIKALLDAGNQADTLRVVGDHDDALSVVLDGGGGDDEVTGGDGPETLAGGEGNDVLDGGAGDDAVIFDAGMDSITGGPGVDTFDVSAVHGYTSVDLQAGQSTVYDLNAKITDRDSSLEGVENVKGASDLNYLYGDEQPNRLVGGGFSMLVGRDGNDTLVTPSGGSNVVPGGGDDVVQGGPDASEAVYFSFSPNPVTVDLANGTAQGEGNDTLERVVNVAGSPYDDTLVGDEGPNVIFGDSGDDVIRAAGGADEVFGDLGDDDVDGGGGTDLLNFNPDPDDDDEDRTPISVDLRDGSAVGRGTDSVAHFEDVRGGAGPDELVGDDGDNHLEGGGSGDHLVGLGGDDRLENLGYHQSHSEGGAGNDVLEGGYYPDRLEGGSGDDVIRGHSGNDQFLGGPGDDVLEGGADRDTISFSPDVNGVDVSLREGTATGEGHDTLVAIAIVNGTEGDDNLEGANVYTTLNGAGGDDHLTAYVLPDTLNGGPGNDLLDGGEKADHFSPGLGDDVIRAGGGNEEINTVGQGVDSTFCGEGLDRVTRDREDVSAADCEELDIDGPPTVSIDSGPQEGETVQKGRATWSISFSDAVKATCSIGSSGDSCLSGTFTGDVPFGDQTLVVRAEDISGHLTIAQVHIHGNDQFLRPPNFDDTPPSETTDDYAHFEFHGPPKTTPECSLNYADFDPCPSGAADFSGLQNARYHFEYRLVDRYGNIGPSNEFDWSVFEPEALIRSGPERVTGSQEALFTFASSRGPGHFVCYLDSEVLPSCASSGVRLEGLSGGGHKFEVMRVTDDGESHGYASYSWTVDIEPPDSTIEARQTTTTRHRIHLRTGVVEPGNTITCVVHRFNDVAFDCSSGHFYSPRLSVGTHVISAVAEDAYGNVDQSPAEVTVRVTPRRKPS